MALVTWGLGPGGGGGTSYTMRAFHTVFPTGFVYWTVSGTPDSAGAYAPYPAVELTGILIFRAFIPGA